MRGTDEQLRIVRSKAAKLRRRRDLLRQGAAAALCLALITALGLALPRVGGRLTVPGYGAFGSLVLATPALGYIVIGVLSFALGVCLTLLCIHRRRRWDETEDEER